MRPGDEAALAEQARTVLAAREEWRRREAGRSSLAGWCEYGPPTERGAFVARRWQRHLAARLERFADEVAAGRSPRLIIHAPPQSGKSEIVARRFPVWCLARGLSVALCSYADTLAVEHSIAARGIAQSPEAGRLWPHLTRPSEGARDARGRMLRDTLDDWTVPASGDRPPPRYLARGVGGGLSGRSVDLVVIDDPFQDAGDAASASRRAAVWSWYLSAVRARVDANGGGVIVMHTRWHVDDLAGRLERETAEPWEVLSYPLIAGEHDATGRAPGEPLDGWTLEAAERTRLVVGSRLYAAMYQGRPTLDEGALIRRVWLSHRYDELPEVAARRCDVTVLSLDPAATEGSGDHSVLQWWGWQGGRAYLLGQWRGQWAYPTLRQTVLDVHAKVRPSALLVEDTSSGRALADELARAVSGLVRVPAKGAKASRIAAETPAMEAGSVLLPSGGPWVGDLVERLVVITGEGDEVDDEADAMAMALRWHRERDVSTFDPRAYLRAVGYIG